MRTYVLPTLALDGMIAAGAGLPHTQHRLPPDPQTGAATARPQPGPVTGLPDFTPIVRDYGPAAG